MKKGSAAVFLSYVLWGVFPIYWKLLAGVDSVYVLCCRIVFSLCVSLVVVPLCGKWGEAVRVLRDKRLRRYMLAAGVFISFNWGAFIYCVASNRVLDASLAYYINPILAILVGFIVFRERLTTAQWAAVALAAAGVAAPMVMEGEFPLLAAHTSAAGGRRDLPAALPLFGGHTHDLNVAFGHTHVHKSDLAASLRRHPLRRDDEPGDDRGFRLRLACDDSLRRGRGAGEKEGKNEVQQWIRTQ